MAFRPFDVLLTPSGKNFKTTFGSDGSASVTELDAGVVDLVEEGELEDDTLYEIENIGTFRADFMPGHESGDTSPAKADRRGKRLLPRGNMATAVLQPQEGAPFWIWAAEDGPTRVMVTEAPQ